MGLGLLFSVIFALPSQAEPRKITLRQGEAGYAGAEDVSLDYQLRPSGKLQNNMGRSPTLSVYCSGGKLLPLETGESLRNEDGWNKVALLRFDLSSLPGEATIQAATLVLTVVSPLERKSSMKYALHRLQRSGLRFGSADGEPEDGAVSPQCSETPETGWGDDDRQLMPRLGRDIENSPFATATLHPGETRLIFKDIPAFILQDWREEGNGFVVYPCTPRREGGVQVQFASSEHRDETSRPTLEILSE